MIKFFYDLMVFIATNYSQMPDVFKKRFPEEMCVNARLVMFDIYHNEINDFADYE